MLHFFGESCPCGHHAAKWVAAARMECCRVPANRETQAADQNYQSQGEAAATQEARGDAAAQAAPAERAEELRRQIREADYAYYALDNPTLSDAQYDELMRQLRALEEA